VSASSSTSPTAAPGRWPSGPLEAAEGADGAPSSSVCSAERLPRQRVMQALPPARPHQPGRFNIVAPPAAAVAPITRRQRLWSEMANHRAQQSLKELQLQALGEGGDRGDGRRPAGWWPSRTDRERACDATIKRVGQGTKLRRYKRKGLRLLRRCGTAGRWRGGGGRGR
jgi:hypothetical protein